MARLFTAGRPITSGPGTVRLFALGLFLAVVPAAAAGQGLDLKLGVGPTVATISDMRTGIHAYGAVEWFPTEIVGFRVDGFLGVAGHEEWRVHPTPSGVDASAVRVNLGATPIYSAGASLILREPPGPFRLYGLLGWSYNHSEIWNGPVPSLQAGDGWTFGVGLDADVFGGSWFVEITGHVFDTTRGYLTPQSASFIPITFGIRF